MVSPGPSVRMTKGRRRGKRKLHRPQDIREGVTNAYHIVKDVSRLYRKWCNFFYEFNIKFELIFRLKHQLFINAVIM